MNQGASFARHLALSVGAIEALLGICLLVFVAAIGSAAASPLDVGKALVIGGATLTVVLPTMVTVLALRTQKNGVVYASLALLLGYPVIVIGTYSTYA